jgi:hypothetical protein
VRPLVLLCLLAAIVRAQQVTPIQVPPESGVQDAIYADVNGDGLTDLVIAVYSGTKNGTERALRVHFQRAKGVSFVNEPDHELRPVFKDVVAYAVADVHPDAGSEIVLMSAKGIWAWRPNAPEKERATKLVACSFLWQLPNRWRVVAWQQAIHDLNGDGRVDLLLPEPDGYRVAYQTAPGEFAAVHELVVPTVPVGLKDHTPLSVRARSRRLRTRVEVRLSVGETQVATEASSDGTGTSGQTSLQASGPLLEVADTVPAPQLADWDADDDLDIIVRTENWLHVWTQDNGAFKRLPSASLDMPVKEDRARRMQVSYSAHVTDFDLDKKADCVIFSNDDNSDDVRTQVQFFTQRGKPLFDKGVPDDMLVLAGFAGLPRMTDIDGDGYPDLMVGAFRPDLLDTIRAASNKKLEAELYLFRNRRGKLRRKPDLVYRAEVQVEGLKLAPRQNMTAEFFGDATGDGIRDLLVRQRQDRIDVLMVRRQRDGSFQVIERPVYQVAINENAWVRIGPDRGRRKAPDVIVLENTQVLHVRFK